MANLQCWRCLISPTRSIRKPISAQHLSTSTSLAAPPPKPKHGITKLPVKGESKTYIRKKQKPIAKASRPPAVGERKAQKKRIVLNNPNALEVPWLQELRKETTLDRSIEGSVVAISSVIVEQLRTVGAFKPSQRWSSLRRPVILLTGQRMELARELEDIEKPGQQATVRRVYTGIKGTGKSTMLLQAMAIAFSRGWMVMSIPECACRNVDEPTSHHSLIVLLFSGQDLTNAHTEYAPLSKSMPDQYVQRTYTSSLLSQIIRANGPTLSRLHLSQEHNPELPVRPNLSLIELATIGVEDPDIAWPIFQALWQELTVPSTDQVQRPPIMITMDGISHLMRTSNYQDPQFKPIHAHNLVLVQHLLGYLSGAKPLPNGGAVLAAVSNSDKTPAPTLSTALRQLEARAPGSSGVDAVLQANPFEESDDRVLEVMRDVQAQRLRGLSKPETRALLEYYAASGILRERIDQRKVGEKWTLAGGGIIGEVENVALMKCF